MIGCRGIVHSRRGTIRPELWSKKRKAAHVPPEKIMQRA
jgi:hypothetical protein